MWDLITNTFHLHTFSTVLLWCGCENALLERGAEFYVPVLHVSNDVPVLVVPNLKLGFSAMIAVSLEVI